jgi:hypothetical protein
MRAMRITGFPRWALFALLGMGAGFVPRLQAQEPTPTPADEDTLPTAPRPGMWQLGPFYLTPKFRVGTIGLDTNVLYTPTDRTTDISASGGPGLELVLPLGRTGRFYTEGFLDYLYFVKTESQRRLQGNVRGGFDFRGLRSSLVIEEYWNELFARPTFEVNQRVEQVNEGTTLDFKRRLFGRISWTLAGERRRNKTEDDAEYLGVDLSRTLTSNTYTAGTGLEYSLSVKTSFVVEFERQWYRYPLAGIRDSDSNRLWAGFRTDETALIAGHALVGYREFRFQETAVEDSTTVVDVVGMISISPKTRIGGSYVRDLAYSALPTVGFNPLMTQQRYGARIEKDLGGNVDLLLSGYVTRIESKSPVIADVPGEGPVARLRDDTYRLGTADLGYRFRPNLRFGVTASYGNQDTTIDYFGVEGLVVGATIRYNP